MGGIVRLVEGAAAGAAPNTAKVLVFVFVAALLAAGLDFEVKPPVVVRPPDFPMCPPVGNEGVGPVVMELMKAGVDVETIPDLPMCVVDNDGVGPAGTEKDGIPPDFVMWPPGGGTVGAKFIIPAGGSK